MLFTQLYLPLRPLMSIYAALAIIIATLNVAAFALFGIDKWKARNDGWRIPDAVLLAIAGIGGGLGAHIGMLVFHNKTHHRLFTTLVPIFISVHLLTFIAVMLSLM